MNTDPDISRMVVLPYLPASLDVTDTLVKLCERHPPEDVLKYVKNWVAFMEKCIAVGARIDGDET